MIYILIIEVVFIIVLLLVICAQQYIINENQKELWKKVNDDLERETEGEPNDDY